MSVVTDVRDRQRLEFGKEGDMRFLSHLDLVRLFRRAVRRARLPVAYSGGFNAQPRIRFGPPLPLGMIGRREVAELYLTEQREPRELQERLGREMPGGLGIQRVERVGLQTPGLEQSIRLACYEASFPEGRSGASARWDEARAWFMGKEELVVRVLRAGREQEIDVRSQVGSFTAGPASGVLTLCLRTGSGPRVRPGEVLEVLREKAGAEESRAEIIRTGFWGGEGEEEVPFPFGVGDTTI